MTKLDNRLNAQDFAQIVRNTPLVSIDLILRDPEARVLLGFRNNEPAKGVYFVPGGVIRKNESITSAISRVLKAETGLDAPFSDARLLGAYEHFYQTNRFDDPGYGTHYVVLAYELQLSNHPAIQLDDQHHEATWMTPAEVLASPLVHENTKAYFRTKKP